MRMSPPLVDLTELKAERLLEPWKVRLRNPMAGLSAYTVRSYELGVSRFVAVALPDSEVRSLSHLISVLQDPARLRSAVEQLSTRYSKSTVGVTLAAVKHLAEFMVEINELAAPPAWPKVRKLEPEFDPPHYSPEEAAALVAAAGTDTTSVRIGPRIRVPTRDQAILRILFATGMRAAELAAFDVGWLRGSGEERVVGATPVLPIERSGPERIGIGSSHRPAQGMGTAPAVSRNRSSAP